LLGLAVPRMLKFRKNSATAASNRLCSSAPGRRASVAAGVAA
jgi:hypothetical protein